ncbi:MAG: ABC transporter permease [Verrucomicrobia bacterium]|nr:MAG: ABC transporter permease [Verrucomicrobiota bacterium]
MSKQLRPSISQVSIDSKGVLKLEGRLDFDGVSNIWLKANNLAKNFYIPTIDVHEVEYCDSSGIALLISLQKYAGERGTEPTIQGLSSRFQALLPTTRPQESASHLPPSFPEFVGLNTVEVLKDLYAQIRFCGKLFIILSSALLHPSRIRWASFCKVFESTGIHALPIISLIGFLTGCILAFQALGPLRQFGVEIFAVNLTALALFRELGPIMTAIVLAGRSGSAFAAEIGTMKVNQELDALVTMGITPLQFLVVPRILAALIVTPILTIYMDAIGVAGGFLILMGMGFPFSALSTQLLAAASITDILGGIVKSFFFGFLVSSIGCLRGLQTSGGSTAVGTSTTRAVVSSVVLVVVVDAIFSAVFYTLKF